jgi:hypothetical protein
MPKSSSRKSSDPVANAARRSVIRMGRVIKAEGERGFDRVSKERKETARDVRTGNVGHQAHLPFESAKEGVILRVPWEKVFDLDKVIGKEFQTQKPFHSERVQEEGHQFSDVFIPAYKIPEAVLFFKQNKIELPKAWKYKATEDITNPALGLGRKVATNPISKTQLEIDALEEAGKQASHSKKIKEENEAAKQQYKNFWENAKVSPEKGKKISDLIEKIDKTKNMKDLERYENELKNYIDPEKFDFSDIQEMLYSESGNDAISKIVGHKIKMNEKNIVPDDEVGDYEGHQLRIDIM